MPTEPPSFFPARNTAVSDPLPPIKQNGHAPADKPELGYLDVGYQKEPTQNGDQKPKQAKYHVATPQQVMKFYASKLTPYEHREIFNYPHVYYIGALAKKRPGLLVSNSGVPGSGSGSNYGYDDHQGSYIHIVHDHIQYRYEVLKVMLNLKLLPKTNLITMRSSSTAWTSLST